MIRLARFGAKKKPSYRVVVIEKDRARDGRAVEVLGYYSPVSKPATVKIDRARFDHWVKSGAQPSDTVTRLVKNLSAESHPALTPPEQTNKESSGLWRSR